MRRKGVNSQGSRCYPTDVKLELSSRTNATLLIVKGRTSIKLFLSIFFMMWWRAASDLERVAKCRADFTVWKLVCQGISLWKCKTWFESGSILIFNRKPAYRKSAFRRQYRQGKEFNQIIFQTVCVLKRKLLGEKCTKPSATGSSLNSG